MSNTKDKLFSEFHVPTTQEWLDKIHIDLKGADFNKRLVWRTNEGFSVQPFYRREDLKELKTPDALPGEFPYVRGNKKDNNTWYVRQDIETYDDAASANAKALNILNRGIDSLCFIIPGTNIKRKFIETLLHGIYCECVELNFKTSPDRSLELVHILAYYFTSKGYDKSKLIGSINFDPMEALIMQGTDTTALLSQIHSIVETLRDFPAMRCVGVNADVLSNAGAYIVKELGYALAWGNEYMHLMTEADISADVAAKAITFNLGISGTYFMEIAKFRAARLLWSHVVKQYEPKDAKSCMMCINAITSTYNLTLFDSYVNLLRTQTEAMSAALGGVHSMVVTPFDKAYEQPTDFSERIARNQQLLLKEESHFDKVVDPGAGSYFIEELTAKLAEEAWKIFLSIEDEGGFLEAIKKGIVQDDINATNAKRHDAAAKRKEFMLGTNQFPNFNEKSDGKRAVPIAPECEAGAGSRPFKSIRTTRLAEDFEQLRITVETSKHIPAAFMLTIGNLAMRQARAQFSCNFLACAGYKVIDNLGFTSVEEGVDAALKAGADIVVLCSSDDEYAQYAPPAFKYLDGRAMFVVAGAPACMDDLKAIGIENFIHVRCNVLETLKEYNAKLGV